MWEQVRASSTPGAGWWTLVFLGAWVAGSLIFGFAFSNAAFIPPGLAAKYRDETATLSATCLRSFDGTKTGSISIFRLENGDEWEVFGYKAVCQDGPRQCSLEYSSLLFAHYVKAINCSASSRALPL